MLDMDTVKIGFIGYGNMAGAASAGLMLSGAVSPDRIYACAKNYDKLCTKTEAEGTNACLTSLEVIETCDVIFIGVKPYLVKDVMDPLKDSLEGKIIISLAANTLHSALEEIMPGSHHVATAPNTPVSVCEGIFICEEDNTLTPDEEAFVDKLLANLGLVMWMDKDHIGMAGVLAGCTPAFVAMFMEALGDAGCRHGLTRATSYSLAAQMLAGTGKMALKSGEHPGQMKDAVCSPGGTTIAGVSALEKNGFRYAVIDAIDQIDNKIKGKL